MKYIKDYIEKWNKEESPKPMNDLVFVAEFTKFAKNSDFDQWSFSGENGYCGYTATLHELPSHMQGLVPGLGFEFAYGKDFVKVFTDKHNGFWTPEYISLMGDDAMELLGVIKTKLNGWAGFGN